MGAIGGAREGGVGRRDIMCGCGLRELGRKERGCGGGWSG